MASQQARREDVTDERNIEVEKDRVPKMASHFESLAEKVRGATDVHSAGPVHVKSTVTTVIDDQRDQGAHKKEKEQPSDDVGTQGGKQQVFQEKPGGLKFDEVHGQGHKDFDKSGTEETKGPSLEEVSQYRQTAQQNSVDAIRGAEVRYEKDKNMGASTLHNLKESAREKGAQAKDTITQGLEKGTQYVAEKAGAAKETAVEKGQEVSAVTKDSLASAGQATARSTQQAKDYVAQKSGEAKEYVAPKAGEVQEQSKGAVSYAREKAARVKDATLETGKGAVGYAGKVAETVKDKAVVAGWGAAHYTAEKAADATKAIAGAASTVAGYAGGTTVAAKDYVADAGKKTVGYAEDKLAAAKEYVVSVEESAAEYAARKKAEAEGDLEAKRSRDDTKGESRGGFIGGEKQESKMEEEEGGFRPREKIEESFEEEKSGGGKEINKPVEGAKVVLQAIGETVVEIGKTTTDLVAGGGQLQTGDEPAVGTEGESTTIKQA
ncbi:unnamed protein product [Withania somnifera]